MEFLECSSCHKSPPLIGVYGCGGLGREVMPMVKQVVEESGNSAILSDQLVYVESDPGHLNTHLGYPILSEAVYLSRKAEKLFVVATGSGETRKKLSQRLIAGGSRPISIRSKSSTVYEDSTIDEGAILCASTVLSTGCKVGKYFLMNVFSYLAHDCTVGDYVTFSPNVQCNGNVVIENNVFLGAGAVIRNGTPGSPLVIGKNSIIGMGSIVLDDVEPNTIVAGNPARPIKRQI